MPYLCVELHLGRFIGVLRRQLYIDLVESAFVWSVIGTLYETDPMSQVIVFESDCDCGLFALNVVDDTVLLKSSNSLRMRI